MNKSVRSSLLILLVSGTVSFAPQALSAEPGAWEKFKSFAHHQKTDAVAEGKRILAATDKQIEAMQKDVKHANAETKAAHDKNMAELAAKKRTAQAELARLEKSASNTWDASKEGVSKAYRDLQEAYDKATASAKK